MLVVVAVIAFIIIICCVCQHKKEIAFIAGTAATGSTMVETAVANAVGGSAGNSSKV